MTQRETGLSDGGYEMLRMAVNTARQSQCRTVGGLKKRLLVAWPDRQNDIDEAVRYWAADVRRRYPNGPDRR